MRLTDLYIDGFGIFHNLNIEGIGPELTVFLGMNESGKSTLLGFIRAIFFGFPDGRSNENLYPPLAGGQHGGNLTLLTDDQHLYVIERYPGPRGGKVNVLKPDQTRGGTGFLSRLLGMANRTLFKNVYAFSLSELQNFETLNTESVREALYSAGAGIDPNRLVRLKSELEKKEGELYKPGGSKPRINALLARLNIIAKEKKALRGSVEEYDLIKTHISRLQGEICELVKQKLECSVQLKGTEQWIHIWPEWISLSLARQKLEQLEFIDHFPPQGLSRFENLKTRFEDLKNDLLKKEEDLRRLESELAALETDPALLNHAPSIRRLQREQGHFEAVNQELLSLGQQLSTVELKLKENLNQLGPEWTEEKILEFDLSIAAREEVRHFREILQQTKMEEQRRRESLELLAYKKHEAEQVMGSLREPSVKDPKRLIQMRKSCAELRTLESEYRLFKKEMGSTDDRLQDLKEQEISFEEDLRPGTYGSPLWLRLFVIGAGILFLILSGFHVGRPWALPAGALLLLFGLLLWFFKAESEKKEKKRNEKIKQRIQRVTEKMIDLETKRSDSNTDLDRMRERMLGLCADLSISEVPSGAELERMEEQLSEGLKGLERWIEATEELLKAERRQEQARRELDNAETEATRIQNQWQKWLRDRGLSPFLTPDGTLETLSSIASFREQTEHLTQLRVKMASLEKTKKEFFDLANQVLRGCNREAVGDAQIQGVVHDLIQEFIDMERAEEKRALLTNEIGSSRESIERIQEMSKKTEREMHDLMISGGADEEEEFRRRAQIYDGRAALLTEVERHEDSIRRFSDNLGTMGSVGKKLSTTSREKLEEQKVRLEHALEEVEANLDRSKREEATLEEQARQLVNDERLSELRAEEEGLKEELSFLAAQWSTMRLAQALIRGARERYQRDMQPEVIRKASRFFNQLTLGKYPSLLAPIGEDRIEVMCVDKTRKEIGQLSRGTAEQLYLSLRFGFIREFSKTTESLPLIMDEILVNFDPRRARATADAITGLSREHQVLFFTCHPEMVGLFRDIDPHTPVLEISEQGVKRWTE